MREICLHVIDIAFTLVIKTFSVMSIREEKAFEGTSLYSDVCTINSYYSSIENDFDAFSDTFNIHCPAVCGRCCEHFIPDITYLEALALAWELGIRQDRDLDFLIDWHRNHDYCPLYNAVTHRCTAYAVRPVICRVFCSSASRTKEGLSFRGCRLSVQPEGMPASLSDKALSSAGFHVPVMSDYGEKIDSMQASSERILLDDAVLSAWSKIRLIQSISLTGDDESGRAG